MRASTRVARGQHQHRHVLAGSAQAAAHIEPALSRQHHIEHHDVVIGVGQTLGRDHAVVDEVHGICLFAQSLSKEPGGGALVFDE